MEEKKNNGQGLNGQQYGQQYDHRYGPQSGQQYDHRYGPQYGQQYGPQNGPQYGPQYGQMYNVPMTQKNLSGWQVFGNILWLIFGGFELAILSFIEGLICCVTIIFIPVGLQYFKLGVFFIWPLGKTVQSVKQNGFKMFVNVLWAILAGWEHFIFYSLVGIVYCATIIGIPFGLQMFKVALFIIAPLGRDFVMPMVPVYQQK